MEYSENLRLVSEFFIILKLKELSQTTNFKALQKFHNVTLQDLLQPVLMSRGGDE